MACWCSAPRAARAALVARAVLHAACLLPQRACGACLCAPRPARHAALAQTKNCIVTARPPACALSEQMYARIVQRSAAALQLASHVHLRVRYASQRSFMSHACARSIPPRALIARIRPPPRMPRRVRARHSHASKRTSPVTHAPLASSLAASAALRAARQAALCAGQSCTWCSLQQ